MARPLDRPRRPPTARGYQLARSKRSACTARSTTSADRPPDLRARLALRDTIGCIAGGAHTTAGRAHQSLGTTYANGSNQNMGLWNIFVTTTLKQTGPNFYVIGTCP